VRRKCLRDLWGKLCGGMQEPTAAQWGVQVPCLDNGPIWDITLAQRSRDSVTRLKTKSYFWLSIKMAYTAEHLPF
jgi:hypothetical protein